MSQSASSRQEVQEAVRAYLQQRGCRMTKQRLAIIEATFTSEDHFTADDLWERSVALEPSVSRPTVYRTLKLMVESGYLKLLDLSRDQQHYDPNSSTRPRHNHIICADCDKVIEFDDPCLELREGPLINELGFNIQEVSFKVVASCQQLLKTGKCSRKE